MSTGRPTVRVRDLAEEAKKRIVYLIICVVGLSYLMSLTSSSVWVNLPAAALFIVVLRYFSLDFDMRRKAAAYNTKTPTINISSEKKPFECPKFIVERSDWRRKVNSPVVEDAIDQLSRHLISEWVTDLWYSRITPDKQSPDELVQIMNGVLGEISCRVRNINLIDFLTRDIINLVRTNLELFRASHAKIGKQQSGMLTIENRDTELKLVLAADDKLHPALFSAEAEHKVLQHLMDGLVSFTFNPEDLQCSLFRYIVRELLACAVMRPVLNLASPRFINERIESLVISLSKADKGPAAPQVPSPAKAISSDHFSRFLDPCAKGVELVQLKKDQPETAAENTVTDNTNGTFFSKDPLLSVDARSTRSWNSFPSNSQISNGKPIQRHHSGGEWGDRLDLVSRRKTEVLAPENFENMWTKGRNYKKKEDVKQPISPASQSSLARISRNLDHSKPLFSHREKEDAVEVNLNNSPVHSGCNDWKSAGNSITHGWSTSSLPPVTSYVEDEHNPMHLGKVESGMSDSYTSEEETSSVTGLDSPGTKVWDGKNNRNLSVSQIHHPLESSEGHKTRKVGKGHGHSHRLADTQSGLKSSQKVHFWQEVERTSFLSGDGQDILNSPKGDVKAENSSDDSESEALGRIYSGATASSSASSISISKSCSSAVNSPKSSLLSDSFLKLRCEVSGANVVKSGSKTFAVYCISVTDINNNTWSIKRRFRHFEELHRRLKEFPEYNLHLPPKHFLSTGLDVPVIQERCKLLDEYLKKLLQLPTISESIEVWDFLSVDSQTYIFSNSISIIETLSDHTARERSKEVTNVVKHLTKPLSSGREYSSAESKESALAMKHNAVVTDGSRLDTKLAAHSPSKNPMRVHRKPLEDSDSDSDNMVQKRRSEDGGLQVSSGSLVDAAACPALPAEWVPPNLSLPILDLVDVIFQLQDGGWIRRNAFWVAKQVLQLGMGDAFDDWLIEKIQLLRRGSVVASGIRRVEQILWPDGIFITKHPKRQQSTPSRSPSQSSLHGQPPMPLSSPKTQDIQKLDEKQRKEAEHRAKFVYELMIDHAPAPIVGLVGRKEYEQCAKDLYYFLQSPVCLKQLAFDLIELLLMSAFPELDHVFKQVHEKKQKFGEFQLNK